MVDKNVLRIPYGVADFYSLRTEGQVYVDRTDRIGLVEELGKRLVFLRPRRFGKSLWLSTLATYYDLRHAGEHERLASPCAPSSSVRLRTRASWAPTSSTSECSL